MTIKKPLKKNKTKSEATPWRYHNLETSTPSEKDQLDVNGKFDGVDLCQHHVRSGRFSTSFMMATNGGAACEDILRTKTVGRISETDSRQNVTSHTTLQNVIGKDDERTVIFDTSRIPARSVGLLKIFPSDGFVRWGTAWLIGPRTLATAAHNLVHPDSGKAIRLEVGLAYDGNSARGGWHRIIDSAFLKDWEDNPMAGSPNDFAVLKIEDAKIGNSLGWFGFADYEDKKFNNLLLNLFGYPMDKKKFHMYGTAGRAVQVEQSRIYHDCDTGCGMSGGPVIARFGEQRIAVGIHVAGGIESNVATRITEMAYALLEDHKSW